MDRSSFDPIQDGYNQIAKGSKTNTSEVVTEMSHNGRAFQFSNGNFSFIVVADNEDHAIDIVNTTSDKAASPQMTSEYRAAANRQNGYKMQPLATGQMITVKSPFK